MRSSTKEEYERTMAQARAFVDAYLSSPVTLSDFVARTGYSRRQIQRVFMHNNTTWRNLITTRRMEKASELLMNTTGNVNDVAVRVGYRQPAQFAKAFRRAYGVPPSEYRKVRAAA